jgi:hypothetical protein
VGHLLFQTLVCNYGIGGNKEGEKVYTATTDETGANAIKPFYSRYLRILLISLSVSP